MPAGAIKIWADNSNESLSLVKYLNNDYRVNHILTASPQPVVSWNGNLIIGLGKIYNYFKGNLSTHIFQPKYEQ